MACEQIIPLLQQALQMESAEQARDPQEPSELVDLLKQALAVATGGGAGPDTAPTDMPPGDMMGGPGPGPGPAGPGGPGAPPNPMAMMAALRKGFKRGQ